MGLINFIHIYNILCLHTPIALFCPLPHPLTLFFFPICPPSTLCLFFCNPMILIRANYRKLGEAYRQLTSGYTRKENLSCPAR